MESKFIKVLILGDVGCGKKSLQTIIKLMHPSINSTKNLIPLRIFNNDVLLELNNTAGLENYEEFRHWIYGTADIIILCFAINSPESLSHIETKWIKEVKYFFKTSPIILVGNKKDLRFDKATILQLEQSCLIPVQRNEGHVMKEKIGAKKYLECSALNNDGVEDVLVAATYAYLNKI